MMRTIPCYPASMPKGPTRINVFVSVERKKEMKREAKACGMTLSEFIRQKLGDWMPDRRKQKAA
jgi:hypothetical protein